MAQYPYRIQPTRPAMLRLTPEEDAIISQHFAYLQNLTAQGIVIFNAADDSAARAVMNGDPAVRQGVMRAELFPFRIALWSPPEET
jgi:uncharacterized protein YciI